MAAFVRTAGRRLVGWWRRAPVTLALVAIIVATTVASGELLHPLPSAWRRAWADGTSQILHGRFWTPITATGFAPNPVGAVVLILLLLTIGAGTERFLGSRRTLLVGLIGTVAGGFGATGSALLARWADPAWGRMLLRELHVGCEPWLAAGVMAASARLDTLWRRRVRVVVGMTLALVATFGAGHRDLAMAWAGLAGFLLGPVLAGRGPERTTVGTRGESRRLVALAVGGFVVAALASTLAASPVGPLASVRLLFRDVPYDAAQLAEVCADSTLARECRRGTFLIRNVGLPAFIAAAGPLVLLTVLARGLANGRRAAWRGTLGVLGTYLGLWTAHLVQLAVRAHAHPGDDALLGFDPRRLPSLRIVLPVVLLLALLALVAYAGPTFTVHTPRGASRRALLRTAGVTLLSAVAAVGIGLVFRDQFTPVATAGTLLGDFVLRLFPTGMLGLVDNPVFATTSRAAVFAEGLPAVPWLWAAVELWRLFGRHAADATTADRDRMVALLHSPGGSTLSWWSTWGDGNQWWFSPTREAGVAYRIVGDVAVTPCAPACAPEDLRAVIEEFAGWAAAQGLTPALHSVHADVAAHTDDMGWAKVEVAEETLLHPQQIEWKGKKFQDIRTAINRAEREGVHVVHATWHDTDPALRAQVAALSEGWVADKGLPEMGFTLGALEELDDPEVVLFLAVDADVKLHGVTSWLPVYRDGKRVGITLDFMRRGNGFKMSMELLIAQAVLWAKEEGLEVVSLSGAPLARAAAAPVEGAAPVAGWSGALDAMLQRAGALLEPAYGFRSLLAFKAKFQPEYRPMYLVVPEVAELPAVGRALAAAYVPTMGWAASVRTASSLLRRQKPAPTPARHDAGS